MIKIVIYYFQQELQGINFKPNYKSVLSPWPEPGPTVQS